MYDALVVIDVLIVYAIVNVIQLLVLVVKSVRINCFVKESIHCSIISYSRYQKIILFYAPKKGWGIKAAAPIPKGTFIIEYVGEVISQKESEIRRQVGSRCCYLVISRNVKDKIICII